MKNERVKNERVKNERVKNEKYDLLLELTPKARRFLFVSLFIPSLFIFHFSLFRFSFFQSSTSQLLHVIEVLVITVDGQQLLMCAALHDATFVQDADFVGILDGAEAVGNGDGGA